jgi:hypothetical protein
MSSRRLTKEARARLHETRRRAFHRWLDGHWFEWQPHVGTRRYDDLWAAFTAGWRAA